MSFNHRCCSMKTVVNTCQYCRSPLHKKPNSSAHGSHKGLVQHITHVQYSAVVVQSDRT